MYAGAGHEDGGMRRDSVVHEQQVAGIIPSVSDEQRTADGLMWQQSYAGAGHLVLAVD